MNKDERSAASTGADSDPHRSNELNPRILPNPGSPEASAMMDSLLTEYQWPAHPKDAARAGWEAANRWLRTGAQTASTAFDKSQLDAMVNRFLGWKLPQTFGPDCYVAFDREKAKTNNGWPTGTNLLTAGEARAMLEYALDVTFIPDWSMLKATQASLREHMAMVKELRSELDSQSARQRPGAQAPSTAAPCPDCKGTGADDPSDPESIPCGVCSGTGLAAPSTGGAETAAQFVLSDVDPVVIAAWRLQGRKVGAMLSEAQAAVIELTDKLDDGASSAPASSTGGAETAILQLIAEHAKLIDGGNDHAYFELAYTRRTGWMAWLTDRPASGEPGTAAYAASRKVIARGQGDTAEEACADALAALQSPAASPASKEDGSHE